MISKAIIFAFIGLLIAAPMHVDQSKAIAQENKQTGSHGTMPPVEPVAIKEVEPLPQVDIQPVETIEPIVEEPVAEPVAPSQSVTNYANMTPQDMMRAVGIPEHEWYYVDCVINGCEGVSPEGGWNGAQRWNEQGSGAYGICQALPASKMAQAGADYMTNPVTQLKWCHAYAQAYGSWKDAFAFRKCVGHCYSARTGGTVYKDHTWW